MVKGSLTNERLFEQRPEQSEALNHACVWEKAFPMACKGPVVGAGWVYSRYSEKASVLSREIQKQTLG